MNLLSYHGLTSLVIFCFLPLIPILDLYYLFPQHNIDFGLMPKMEQFLAKYSLEEVKKYNVIVWNTFFLWLVSLILIFFSGQIINAKINKRHCKRNWKQYLITFLCVSILPAFFSLLFIFDDLATGRRGGRSGIYYVNNMLIEDYVFFQCVMFYIFMIPISVVFYLLTIDDFENQTLVIKARKNTG